jgi:hypothetical protein
VPSPPDEGHHRPPSPRPPGWVEWWSFDAVAPSGDAGVFVRIALHPGLRRCSYWAGLVAEGAPYLLVRDDDLDVPPASLGLEVRGSLWAMCHCEDPLSHWTLGLESWAVVFEPDDLADAWGSERGGRTGLALDLSFEDEDDGGGDLPVEDGYWRSGRLWGDVTTGTSGDLTVLDLEGWPAVRRHAWGSPRATSWTWSFDRVDGSFEVAELGEHLPRDLDGLPLTDGHLHRTVPAPVLATEPAGWRVGRAVARTADTTKVGWLESWYPPA